MKNTLLSRSVRAAVILGALAFSLGLSACGDSEPAVDRGVVVEQRYIPAHDEQDEVPIYITMCVPSGNTMNCTQTLTGYETVTEHHPDLWEVKLLSCRYGGKEPCRTGWAEVGRSDYAEIKTGDQWPRWWNDPKPDTAS